MSYRKLLFHSEPTIVDPSNPPSYDQLPIPAGPDRGAAEVPPSVPNHDVVAEQTPSFEDTGSQRKHHFWEDQRLPAGLISTIIHTILLLVLALLTLEKSPRGDLAIAASRGEASNEIRLEAVESSLDDLEQDQTVAIETVKIELSQPSTAEEAIYPDQPGSPQASIPLPNLELNAKSSSSTVRLPGKASLEKRTPQGRLEMGKKYGATVDSERAVELALAYLAAHQRSNGSWSFDLNLAPCNGQCRHSKEKNSDSATPVTGATGLALLAFLGAGHTHQRSGPYQETVRRGIYFLRSIAGETAESGYDWQQGSMYGHGIALMALEEALNMTREGNQYDSDLADLVQQGTAFTCIAQHPNGSWGYVPGRPGDVTITGWQVLSLIGAQKCGAALHTNTLPDAKNFLMTTCEGRSFWFGYNSPPGEPTTTAIGLTLMLFLGQSPYETPFQRALERLAKKGPLPNNIYHNYYTSLALHHSRHPAWENWNQQLRDYLVETQETQGHETGSWHFNEKWGNVGGRLYTTALAAMTLEVYYRFMPLYAADDLFPL